MRTTEGAHSAAVRRAAANVTSPAANASGVVLSAPFASPLTVPWAPFWETTEAWTCPQSPELSSLVSGTRITGTPPLEYSTSMLPLLPTAYCLQVRMLKRDAGLAVADVQGGYTHSVVETLLSYGVCAEMLTFWGYGKFEV